MTFRCEHIGATTLYLGNALDVLPMTGRVDHVISDPPYEASLHASKAALVGRKLRNDGVSELKGLDFDAIDDIRQPVVDLVAQYCDGWFIAFCTVEGVAKWADAINPSSLKYKRACIWVKPDSTPQLNGQCPAQGAECFVCAWGGGRPFEVEWRRQARRLHPPSQQPRAHRSTSDRKAEAAHV